MTKKLFFTAVITLISLTSLTAQSMSNLVFDSELSPSDTDMTFTFDYSGLSAGDTMEWILIFHKADGTPDWGKKRPIDVEFIVPVTPGSGTQTITVNYLDGVVPVVGESYTWAGKIVLATGTDTGYNNRNNLVTIVESTASVGDVFSEQISLYPNPSSDVLNISNKNLDIKSVQIFSLIGKKVIEYQSNNKDLISIDVSNLSKGIYLVSAGNKKTAKFIKE